MNDEPNPAKPAAEKPAIEPVKPGHRGHKKHAPLPQWSKDFPMAAEQAEYVGRRDFTKLLVLTSVGLLAGQAGIGAYQALATTHAKPLAKPIVRLDQLPVGDALPFTYPTPADPCVLVRRTDTELVAYSQRCTHLNCPVIPRVRAGEFQCPCHAGRFDMTTGKPLAGPPRRGLTKVVLEIREGTIYAVDLQEQA